MDFGVILLIVFFGWLAWLMLRPKAGKEMVCASCGTHGKAKVQTRGSIWIEIILWLCFIVPGLIYSIWRLSTRRNVCASCGSESLVTPQSPVGQKLLNEFGSQAPK